MILKLRKKHFEIWVILAFLLPAGIIYSYYVVKPETADEFSAETKMVYPVLISSFVRNDYEIILRRNEKNYLQIEWVGKTPVKSPAPFLQLIVNGMKEDVGSAGSKGRLILNSSLQYSIDSKIQIILSDRISQQKLDEFNL
jgi:hypothetical protein